MRTVRVIGVTGSFGSGKSTVANMFRNDIIKTGKKCKVIDADRIAGSVMKRRDIKRKIVNAFDTTNRKGIADIVFSDRRMLKKLNDIVHPFVISEIKKEIKKETRKQKNKAIILDVPLLFESRLDRICDIVVLVKCRKDKQIKRLVRKGFSKEDVLKRTKSQMPFKHKARKSTYIMNNSGKLAETKMHVKEIREKIIGVKI